MIFYFFYILFNWFKLFYIVILSTNVLPSFVNGLRVLCINKSRPLINFCIYMYSVFPYLWSMMGIIKKKKKKEVWWGYICIMDRMDDDWVGHTCPHAHAMHPTSCPFIMQPKYPTHMRHGFATLIDRQWPDGPLLCLLISLIHQQKWKILYHDVFFFYLLKLIIIKKMWTQTLFHM